MPGFAPLATAPLGSVGGVASRQAAVAGDFGLRGQALAGLRASAAVYDDAPGFTGGAAAGGTVEAAGGIGTAGLAGQAQGDTATHASVANAILSLEGAVRVRAATTAAAVGTLSVILHARSSSVSTIRSVGAVSLSGAKGAATRISGSAAPLWEVLSNADAETAIDGQVNDGRLLHLMGTGQGYALTQPQGVGRIDLGGHARLGVAVSSRGVSGTTTTGTSTGTVPLRLSLASDFGLIGVASGISLRVREASSRAEISLTGRSTVSLLLTGGLGAPITPLGTARALVPGQALAQSAIGITRGIATEVHIGATAGRVLPLEGGAAAHAALRAEAQSVVVTAGLGHALVATRLVLSSELASELVAAAEIGAMARASGALGTAALFDVSAPIELEASDRLWIDLDASGLSLGAAQAAGALSPDGHAQGAALGAAAADARLAVQAACAGYVGLSLTVEPQLALATSMAGRAGLRADLQGTVAVSGRGDAALRVSASSQTASLPLVGRLQTVLAVNAVAQGQIAFARDSHGEVGIDAISVPALGLGLVTTGRLATDGTSADILAFNGASGSGVSLAGSLQDKLAFDAAAATLAGVASFGGSEVPLSGVTRARATTKALVFGSVTIARDSDVAVAVLGRAQPALSLPGVAVATSAIQDAIFDGVAPFALVARVSAAIAVAAGSGLTVTGAAIGGLAIAGQSASGFQVRREGSADVAIAAKTARIIASPGRGVAAVTNDAGTESEFLMVLRITGGTGILMRIVGKAFQGEGAARSSVAIAAAVQDEPWPTMLLARGFRAPPGLRRSASPNATQGGSVISHARGGVLLSEPRTGRVLRG